MAGDPIPATPGRRGSPPAFWRSRRGAAIAGIAFGVLLITSIALVRFALSEGGFEALQADAGRRALIEQGLGVVPFAGIAFLWFIGVVREQLAEIEDRLFSTVFLGSGLLFLALMFLGAVTSLFPAWVLLLSVVILLTRPKRPA